MAYSFPSYLDRTYLEVFQTWPVINQGRARFCSFGTVKLLLMYLLFIWHGMYNGPNNGFTPIKIIKSKCHIKNRYIGNFMSMSFAVAVFYILYYEFCILFCMLLVLGNSQGPPHPMGWPSPSIIETK